MADFLAIGDGWELYPTTAPDHDAEGGFVSGGELDLAARAYWTGGGGSLLGGSGNSAVFGEAFDASGGFFGGGHTHFAVGGLWVGDGGVLMGGSLIATTVDFDAEGGGEVGGNAQQLRGQSLYSAGGFLSGGATISLSYAIIIPTDGAIISGSSFVAPVPTGRVDDDSGPRRARYGTRKPAGHY